MTAEELIDMLLEGVSTIEPMKQQKLGGDIKEPSQYAGYPGTKDVDLQLSKFNKLAKGEPVKKNKMNTTPIRDLDRNEPSDTGLASSGETPY